MTIPTIDVLYSCNLCGLHKAKVTMPARQFETVVEWMKGVCINWIARDHHLRSPNCTATEISSVMIPITGAEKVGGPQVQ